MADELYMRDMSYDKKPDWREQSNCLNYPTAWFDTPSEENWLKAQEVCIECKVFVQCKADANDDDLHWTVRAGERPKALDTVWVDGVQ